MHRLVALLRWRAPVLATLLACFLFVAANAPTAYGVTLTVNSAADTDDGQCTAGAGGCTLREALNQAQRTAVENISFHIGSGAQTINVGSALPYINRPTTLDGTTQPGCAHYPCIELNGQDAGADAKGLSVIAGGVPGVTTVRGLVINRFGGGGIAISSAGLIEGNYLGTSMSGDLPRGNGRDGLEISGDTTVRNNIISGNSEGIRIAGQPTAGAQGITIQGNLIGTDSSGTSPVPNDGSGITLSNVLDSATIGGDIQAERNVISGNGGGISCESPAQTPGPLLIVGNYIGIDATGTNILANTGHGVQMRDSCRATLRENVISGNDGSGIDIIPSSVGNVIQGNFIGTNSTGTYALPNDEGISVRIAGPGLNTIGGETEPERNIISGNRANGIVCYDASPLIAGNYIGMNASGTQAIPNAVTGLSLRFGCSATVRGNMIAGNGNDGIEVVGEEQNEMAANSIHDNGALGIDLGDNGVTPNDPGDADSGPNGLQNFPVLDTAQSDGSSVSVNGTFNSQSNQSYRIEFFGSAACDASGYGEGERFLGSAQIQTDAGGNAAISTAIPAQVGGVMYLTATATSSATSSTSEFSGCALVLGPHGDMNCDLLVDAADALQIFRYLAGPPMHQQPGCPDIGSDVASIVFGDVDCSGDVTTADAMMDLRHAAGLRVTLPPGCGPIGALASSDEAI